MLSRLGMMLVEAGIVTVDEVESVISEFGPGETDLAESLVALGKVPEEIVTEFLAEIYSVDPIYLNEVRLDPALASVIPEDTARKFIIIPIADDGNFVHIAMANPGNLFAVDEVKFAVGREILVFASAPSAVRRCLDDLYGKVDDLVTVEEKLENYDESEHDLETVESLEVIDDEEEEVVQDDSAMGDAPVVKFVEQVISRAVRIEASDIHIEPYERYLRIRYRRDGTCFEVRRLPKDIQPSILSRLKIMARMDIAEKRKTQDGRIKAKVDNRWIDFRVNAVPTVNGEKIVLRILDRGNLEFDLRQLGFPEDSLGDFLRGVHSPYGIVLVTGPTGSGKTTTLYSALSTLNTPKVNIITAEDPVEYNIDGILQTQIDFAMGYDFAAALRAILRQDPNIIMVGEIRDLETASIAIKAALTGHLVFSTIHTNDASSTINRLIDIGIKPFLVASAVRTIMAQRLLRKVCKKCREPHTHTPEELVESGIDPAELEGAETYVAKGCKACNGSGYKGRTGIYEVMTIDKYIRQAVIDKVATGALRVIGVDNGMRTLRMDAIDKLRNGHSTLDEINRVTADDDSEVKEARKRYLEKVEKGELKPKGVPKEPDTKGRLA
ncbi:MAG TPA: ATPase, T2SS/T4P/T4SS family [Candidatus Fermentibacter daniensis]|nr:ATPase, T2SS/T4P/T4SS family [Candidatus Fermentibacter daniensis]